MVTFDKEQGIANDIAEYWAPDAETPKQIVVGMTLKDNEDTVEFYFVMGEADEEGEHHTHILGVPIDRLKKLIESAKNIKEKK